MRTPTHNAGSANWLVAIIAIVALLSNQSAWAGNSHAATFRQPRAGVINPGQDARKLEMGKPIEREISADESHLYQIELKQGQYLSVIVGPKDCDIAITLTGPDDAEIDQFDERFFAGAETVTHVAETAGTYTLTVGIAPDKDKADDLLNEAPDDKSDSEASHYEIRIADLRAATPKDRQLQEARQSSAEASRLIEQGDYAAARKLMERTLGTRRRLLGERDPLVADSLIALADLAVAEEEAAKAEPLYKQALAIYEKAYGPDHPAVLTPLNSLKTFYTRDGSEQEAEAEQTAQRMEKITDKALGPNHPRVLAKMVAEYRDKFSLTSAEVATAISLSQRLLPILEKKLGPEHLQIAELLVFLAQLYNAKEGAAKAEPLYQRALAIIEKSKASDDPIIEACYDAIVEFYSKKGDAKKAEAVKQQAMAAKEKLLLANLEQAKDEDDSLALPAYKEVADFYREKGDLAKAESLLQAALTGKEKELGPEAASVADYAMLLADFYRESDEPAKAEPLYKRALTIAEKITEPDAPEVLIPLEKLAAFYIESKGDMANAEAMYRRILAIKAKHYGADSSEFADSLIEIADVYRDLGEVAKAEPLYQRALVIREKEIKTADASDSSIFENLDHLLLELAKLYIARDEFAKAAPLLQRARAIRAQANLEDSPFSELANSLMNANEYAKAARLLQLELAIIEKEKGAEHPAVADALLHLARVYRTQKDYTKAAPLVERALTIREKAAAAGNSEGWLAALFNALSIYRLNGDKDKEAATFKRLLAINEASLNKDDAAGFAELAASYLEEKNHDYDKAEQLYQRALAVLEKTTGPDSAQVADLLLEIARLYSLKGGDNDQEKATALRTRALEISVNAMAPDNPEIADRLLELASLYLQAEARDLAKAKKAFPPAARDLAKTKQAFQRAVAIKEQQNGPEHPAVGVILEKVADFYRKIADHTKAEALLQRALGIAEKSTLPGYPDVPHYLDLLARFYVENKAYGKAEPLYQRLLAMKEKDKGTNHPEFAEAMVKLADVYLSKQEYDKAEPLFKRALEISETSSAPTNSRVESSLAGFANYYKVKGDYDVAESWYRRLLAIKEKAKGETSSLLTSLAEVYVEKGDYVKAEQLWLQALATREKANGADSWEVAVFLESFAGLYRNMGDMEKAGALFDRALAIREKEQAKGQVEDYAGFFLALEAQATYYLLKGDSAKAESSYQKALKMVGRTAGPTSLLATRLLLDLADVYSIKGDYATAESLCQQALSIREKQEGGDSVGVATALLTLADLYSLKKDYRKAEPLYQRVMAIQEKEGYKVTNVLIRLARLYRNQGDQAKADRLYEQALGNAEQIMSAQFSPNDSFDQAITIEKLLTIGLIYYERGDAARAWPYFKRIIDLHNKVYPNSPRLASLLTMISFLPAAYGDTEKSIYLQKLAVEMSEHNISRNVAAGSERQKLAYLATLSEETYSAITLHTRLAPNSPEALRLALTTILQRKGRALDAMSASLAALRRRLSPEDQKLLTQLTTTRAQLAKLAIEGPGKAALDQYQQRMKQLEDEAERLEDQISRRSAEFRAQTQPVTIAAVQALVPQDAALVEFAYYIPYSFDPQKGVREQGAPRYVAYVLGNQGEPKWKDIGEAKAIDDAVAALRAVLRKQRDLPLSDIDSELKPRARTLDRLVMEPVRQLLGDTRRLLISPDSALNLVPFAALVDEQNRYLVEQYTISYLTSGRDLLRLKEKIQGGRGIAVFANPDYGDRPAADKRPDREQANSAGAATTMPASGGLLSGAYFAPLPGTAEEAKELKRIFPDAIVVEGAQATEGAMKRLAAPSILHVATHGFFLADVTMKSSAAMKPLSLTPQATRLLVQEQGIGSAARGSFYPNPLLRSGVGLAGANSRQSGDDDGILTGLETAALNLWGTKLVVLSACDTGVGEVKTGEGVYGLRRALVLAGSETQMMSLWPVSDTGTRDLMIDYYKGLEAKQGRSEALRQVQLRMLKSETLKHPYYWASFIQSGEWANLEGKR